LNKLSANDGWNGHQCGLITKSETTSSGSATVMRYCYIDGQVATISQQCCGTRRECETITGGDYTPDTSPNTVWYALPHQSMMTFSYLKPAQSKQLHVINNGLSLRLKNIVNITE